MHQLLILRIENFLPEWISASSPLKMTGIEEPRESIRFFVTWFTDDEATKYISRQTLGEKYLIFAGE